MSVGLQQFDYAAFKAGFRSACKKRGIDPVEGATSYQVALYKAEVAKAEKRAAASGWWKHGAMWYDGAAFDDSHLGMGGVSSTRIENAALLRIFIQAYGAELAALRRSIAAQVALPE